MAGVDGVLENVTAVLLDEEVVVLVLDVVDDPVRLEDPME